MPAELERFIKQAELELIARSREKCQASYYEFFKEAWPVIMAEPYIDNWHIKLECEYLEYVRIGEIRNLVINQPPGTCKSLVVSAFYQPWIWTQDPDQRFMMASYAQSLCEDLSTKALSIIQSQWYQDRWGSKFTLPTKPAVTDFENSKKGMRLSTTPGGGLGRHADYRIADDIVKAVDAGIDRKQIKNVNAWLANTWFMRSRNPLTVRDILVMQRLMHGDPADVYLENGATLLALPMKYEPKMFSYGPWGGDVRSTPGELLWPARFPLEEVEKQEKSLGTEANIAAQHGQKPNPASGGIFKPEWLIHTWQEGTLPEKFDRFILSADCTFTDADTSDFVALQVWAQAGPKYYLLDQICARLGAEATTEAIQSLRRKWPAIKDIIIEAKANGEAVIEALKKQVSGVIAITPLGGKESRAAAVTYLFKAGDIIIPEKSTSSFNVDKYKQELIVFNKGIHDDQVDATTQALMYLLGHAKIKVYAPSSKLLATLLGGKKRR